MRADHRLAGCTAWQVFEYINKPGRIIVLYDEDEGIAHKAATTFVQRGVNNVFMLSGGAYAVPVCPSSECSLLEGCQASHSTSLVGVDKGSWIKRDRSTFLAR